MKITAVNKKKESVKTKLLVLPIIEEKERVDIIKKDDFSAERVVELSLKDTRLKTLRNFAARAARLARQFELDEFGVLFPEVEKIRDSVQAVTEGLLLASYQFDKFKSEKEGTILKEASIIFEKSDECIEQGIAEGIIVSEGVFAARDFVNDPANHITPKNFAERIKEMSEKNEMAVKIYDKKEMEQLGMGCLLAVAQGSRNEPRLIVVEYRGSKDSDFYALVGKGVTFDSGGISLKPEKGMMEMKGDMAGGAAVAGAINVIAKLKLPINVTAVIPCVENMPSGEAMRPGDVLLSMSGKTVEVFSTDAEGRLILADALTFISEKKPKMIIDLATLTGSCVVALGYNVAGLFGNYSTLLEKIFESGGRTDERIWQMPLYKESSKAIKSEIADIKNMGHDYGGAGSSTAAAFLKEFVGDTPWAHIDMAGTFWAKEDDKINRKGATGWGVRLLVDFFRNL